MIILDSPGGLSSWTATLRRRSVSTFSTGTGTRGVSDGSSLRRPQQTTPFPVGWNWPGEGAGTFVFLEAGARRLTSKGERGRAREREGESETRRASVARARRASFERRHPA